MEDGPGVGVGEDDQRDERMFTTTKMNMNRSQRRKLPEAVMATSPRAERGTEM